MESLFCLIDHLDLVDYIDSFLPVCNVYEYFGTRQPILLNQARSWFLEITFVRLLVCMCVYVLVYVCVRPRGHE